MKASPVGHSSLVRFRRDLEARGLQPSSVDAYVRAVTQFLQSFGGPPSRVRQADLRNYLVALQERRAPASVNQAIAALGCFYTDTLRRPAAVARLRRLRVSSPVPTILSGSEVTRLLEAAHSAKYRAILCLMYGAGLRVGEATHLRIEDIDSRRMMPAWRGSGAARSTARNSGLRCFSEAEPTRSFWIPCSPEHSSGAPCGAFGAQRFFQKPGCRFGCATA
jgi:integrase/recombinase XerD